jgi:hypothetical protein
MVHRRTSTLAGNSVAVDDRREGLGGALASDHVLGVHCRYDLGFGILVDVLTDHLAALVVGPGGGESVASEVPSIRVVLGLTHFAGIFAH